MLCDSLSLGSGWRLCVGVFVYDCRCLPCSGHASVGAGTLQWNGWWHLVSGQWMDRTEALRPGMVWNKVCGRMVWGWWRPAWCQSGAACLPVYWGSLAAWYESVWWTEKRTPCKRIKTISGQYPLCNDECPWWSLQTEIWFQQIRRSGWLGLLGCWGRCIWGRSGIRKRKVKSRTC